MKKKFFTVEGLDGSGKSTITKHLGEYLTKNEIPNVIVEAYPRDEDSMFRRDLWIQKKVPDIAVLTLILQLRGRVLTDTIIPALLEGKVVISDRWHESTWSYQHYGMGIRRETMNAVFAEMFDIEKFIEPYSKETKQFLREQLNLYTTIHLDVDLETSRRNVALRPGAKDAIEKADDAFFNRLSDGYRDWYRQRTYCWAGPLIMINACQDIEIVKAQSEIAFSEIIAGK